jgi:Flp pilus assembly protein TadB
VALGSRIALMIAVGLGGVLWLAAAMLTLNAFFPIPLAVGVGVFVLQTWAGNLTSATHSERDEAITLLNSAVPKLRVGLPIDSAFILAASEAKSPTADAIADYCARANYVTPTAIQQLSIRYGALTGAIIATINATRRNGGEAARPFASLVEMIETDQKLRRKQQIATLHIRAQANGLLAITAVILVMAVLGNSESLTYLRQTIDGRLMVLFSLTMMLWGYITISALTARIASV